MHYTECVLVFNALSGILHCFDNMNRAGLLHIRINKSHLPSIGDAQDHGTTTFEHGAILPFVLVLELDGGFFIVKE